MYVHTDIHTYNCKYIHTYVNMYLWQHSVWYISDLSVGMCVCRQLLCVSNCSKNFFDYFLLLCVLSAERATHPLAHFALCCAQLVSVCVVFHIYVWIKFISIYLCAYLCVLSRCLKSNCNCVDKFTIKNIGKNKLLVDRTYFKYNRKQEII